jgi:single-stranded-DNA-specific exonuclease
MAAGFSMYKDSYPAFADFIKQRAAELYQGAGRPLLYIDGRLDPENCTMDVYRASGLLEPFGQGNPEPVWIARRLYPSTYRTVGKDGRHLQISFQSGDTTVRAIGFDMGHRTSELNRPLDIAFKLKPDSWRGSGSVQLVLEDMRPAAGGDR